MLTSFLTFAAPSASAQQLMANGLHAQPWINKYSETVLLDSLAEAKASGKGLVILFEQKGCEYCKALHEENFAVKELTNYLTKHFTFMQIDIWSDWKVILPDGKTMTEQDYASSLAVRNTPTTLIMDSIGHVQLKLPGFAPAPVYRAAFEYVVEGGSKSGMSLLPWMRQRLKKKQAEQGG